MELNVDRWNRNVKQTLFWLWCNKQMDIFPDEIIERVCRYLYDEHIFHLCCKSDNHRNDWTNSDQLSLKTICNTNVSILEFNFEQVRSMRLMAGMVTTLLLRQPASYNILMFTESARESSRVMTRVHENIFPSYRRKVIQFNKESITLSNENVFATYPADIASTRGMGADLLIYLYRHTPDISFCNAVISPLLEFTNARMVFVCTNQV